MSGNSVILSVIAKTKTLSSPKWPLMSSGWSWPTKHLKGVHWQYQPVFNWKSDSEGILIWRVLSVNEYLGMKKSLILINITFNVVGCATLHKLTYEKDLQVSLCFYARRTQNSQEFSKYMAFLTASFLKRWKSVLYTIQIISYIIKIICEMRFKRRMLLYNILEA